MLVDSNILVYSLNRSSPKHKQAQQFLRGHREEISVAHQNVLETLRVLTHPKFAHPMHTQQALKAVLGIVQALHLVSPNFETSELALELIERHALRADRVFDAYLVATMIGNGIYTIATDNEKDFIAFAGITVVNPFR